MKKIPFPYRYLATASDRLSVRFEKDHLKEVTAKQGGSFQLEVIKNKKLGSAVINQPDDKKLLAKAVSSADFGDKVNYSYPKEGQFSRIKLHSEKVAKLSPNELIEIGKFIIDAVKEENGDILVDVFISRNEGHTHLENSEGFSGEQEETLLVVSADSELVSEGDILTVWRYYAWNDFVFDKEKFVQKMKEKFLLAKKIASVESDRMPVIFTPEALSSLISPLEVALSARSVYKKVSRWADQLGKKIADARFTLVDDPTINFATGSTNFDDEGSVASPLPLIENGVIKNFYTGLKDAERLGIVPNGRGFGVPAVPDITNIVIIPGKKHSSNLIKGIKRGILVDQVLGAGQDNPYTGDFSFNVHLGFLVENGEITGRIKNCMVSGNIFEMLKNQLGEISSDIDWVGGSLNLPHISFLDVNVIGR